MLENASNSNTEHINPEVFRETRKILQTNRPQPPPPPPSTVTTTPTIAYLDDAWLLQYAPGNIGERSDRFIWGPCSQRPNGPPIGGLSAAAIAATGHKTAIIFGGATGEL